ncbi:hypothetical protein FS837_006817 [Tulasnella sp. UAMH 9824]|nr:hypothetical protein FS837_006817 [Tulasnella sp. UAMH 9824]
MRDSVSEVPPSESSVQKEPSVSSTLGDTAPNCTDDQFLRAQKLMRLVSLAPSSFSSQEKVDAAIAVYEAATRFENLRESRETEADDDEKIVQRQLDLMTGDFRHMKEETTCRLLSLDSKLDRILGSIEESSEKADKLAQAKDFDAQRTLANIEEVHAEVAKLVKQIRDLAIVINKMDSKPNPLVPPSQARPIPRSVPQTEWRYSPSPDPYFEEYPGYADEDPRDEDVDEDPGDEDIDEDQAPGVREQLDEILRLLPVTLLRGAQKLSKMMSKKK